MLGEIDKAMIIVYFNTHVRNWQIKAEDIYVDNIQVDINTNIQNSVIHLLSLV